MREKEQRLDENIAIAQRIQSVRANINTRRIIRETTTLLSKARSLKRGKNSLSRAKEGRKYLENTKLPFVVSRQPFKSMTPQKAKGLYLKTLRLSSAKKAKNNVNLFKDGVTEAYKRGKLHRLISRKIVQKRRIGGRTVDFKETVLYQSRDEDLVRSTVRSKQVTRSNTEEKVVGKALLLEVFGGLNLQKERVGSQEGSKKELNDVNKGSEEKPGLVKKNTFGFNVQVSKKRRRTYRKHGSKPKLFFSKKKKTEEKKPKEEVPTPMKRMTTTDELFLTRTVEEEDEDPIAPTVEDKFIKIEEKTNNFDQEESNKSILSKPKDPARDQNEPPKRATNQDQDPKEGKDNKIANPEQDKDKKTNSEPQKTEEDDFIRMTDPATEGKTEEEAGVSPSKREISKIGLKEELSLNKGADISTRDIMNGMLSMLKSKPDPSEKGGSNPGKRLSLQKNNAQDLPQEIQEVDESANLFKIQVSLIFTFGFFWLILIG